MARNANKRGGSNMTLIIQDENWNKLGSYRWNTSDTKKQNYILKTLRDAFGVDLKLKSDLGWV